MAQRTSELEELRQLLHRAEIQAQKAEEDKQKADEARQKAEEAQQKAEEREREGQRALRKTTLTEYLHLCHQHLSESISVQADKSRSTQGDPSNAQGKLRPDHIRPWDDFLEVQKKTLELLYFSYPADARPRVFENANFIETLGERVASRKLASEEDLQHLQRDIVETPVTKIIEHLQSMDDVRNEFDLAEGIEFDNHLNALSDDAEEVTQRLEQQSLQPFTPRRPALYKPRLRPDQICVYTTVEGLRKPAFVVEYKAPHKLTLAMLRQVLHHGCHTMDLESVISRVWVPSAKDTVAYFEYHAELLVAAVVTQTFSYMVRSGTQYGYITTGEAFVFLHIKLEDNVKTAYYHLAEPKRDVNAQNEDFPNIEDYLHRTAISQVLAFSILALESAQRNLEWREGVIETLGTWEVNYNAILKQIPETVQKSPPMSNYRLHTYRLHVPIRSPVRNRLRPRKTACRPGSNSPSQYDQESPPQTDEESPPLNTPTRPQGRIRGKQSQRTHPPRRDNPSSSGGHKRSFCTQLCLQGLAQGRPLDPHCPNVAEHRGKGPQGDRHPLTCENFRRLLDEQLRRSRGDACQPLGKQGARGALFKITLVSHGYTVVAKGTVLAFVADLRHEGQVYQRLRKAQGSYIPVCLGNIDLEKPYYYDAGICIMHFLLLSWSGECLDERKFSTGREGQTWTTDLVNAVNFIHRAGVLHRDIRWANLLWNEETKRIMVIDFERAVIVKATTRQALLPMSPNRKRKRLLGAKEVEGEEAMVDIMNDDPVFRYQVSIDMAAAQIMFAVTN